MPIYEYECQSCGKVLEVFQKSSQNSITVCINCGGEIKRKISKASFILKGSGWYKTDYADKEKVNTCPPSNKSKDKSDNDNGNKANRQTCPNKD